MIQRDEPRPGIQVITLAHGKANALDLELLRALAETFAELERDSPRAVVLTGTGTIFSAGVDLFRVLHGGAEYVSGFVPALSDALDAMLRFPRGSRSIIGTYPSSADSPGVPRHRSSSGNSGR